MSPQIISMKKHFGLELFALLCFIQTSSCESFSGNWQRLRTRQCLPDTLAARVEETPTGTIECLLVALFSGASSGLLVAQFDTTSHRCSLFRYIAVCRLIVGFDAAKSSEHLGEQLSCAAFANARAASFITLSRKMTLGAGSKLRAAWVMSDDADASRSNLVCGQTQQWKSEGVEWSSEGAKFDGVSSKMWLENVEFANLQQGLTWLIRLKRKATKEATLLETYDCDSKALGNSFWDGSPFGWGLYFFRTASSFSEFSTAPNTNTFDPNKFVEVGIISASPSSRDFYSNAKIVPKSSVSELRSLSIEEMPSLNCISLGFRPGDSRMLKGAVRAVAIMNDTMTESEINHFFGLVR